MRAGVTVSSLQRSGFAQRGEQRATRVAGSKILALAWNVIDTWRQRRQLQQLERRLLKDLGLTPAEVYQEASRPFWDLPRR